jgi:predicted MPP superfamily phosphohydrolase
MRWIVPIAILLFIEIYALQAFRELFPKKAATLIYIISTCLVYGLLTGSFLMEIKGGTFAQPRGFFMGLALSLIVAKIIIIPFVFFEDIFRVFEFIFQKLFSTEQQHFPSRRKFVSTIALGIAAIPFGGILYGMFKGKYNFKVLNYQLVFQDLPKAFEGLRVLQISDIHSGSFDNKSKVEYGIELINQQQADVIFFTGDLVNNLASEMDNWVESFSKIKAKYGVFSVLGNHDYGDYQNWESQTAKQNNFKNLIRVHDKLGWKLLRNESDHIEIDHQKLHIVGVENWGKGGFKQAGDIDKASEGIKKSDFKILLSHDPSHWDEVVKNHPRHFQLTLSGHTHGMQFGIEIPGWFKWSPVQYRYKQWAGLYEHKTRQLNVNRGFGYLAYPGRIGIWPEISVMELIRST